MCAPIIYSSLPRQLPTTPPEGKTRAPRKIRRFPKHVRTPDIFESKAARAAIGSALPSLKTITLNLYLLSMVNGHSRPRGLFLRLEVGK